VEEALWKAAIQKVLKALEDHTLPPTLAYAWEIFEDPAWEIGVDPEALGRAALKEARRWTERVLNGLWEALGTPPPTSPVRKALGWGQEIRVRCPWRQGAPQGEALVETRSRGHIRNLSLPISGYQPSETFFLEAQAGRVEVTVAPKLFARKGRAFLRTQDERGVEKALEEVKGLRPLFLALDLGDLERALEALSGLGDGETRREGTYVLARKGKLSALMRGSYFGDPLLDGAFLLGEQVTLAYENGVEVNLRGAFSDSEFWMEEATLRWQGEVVRLKMPRSAEKDLLDEALPVSSLSTSLWWKLEEEFSDCSPKMKALIAELAEADNPFEALKDKELPRRAALRGLSRL
jgi:hypothetical protein